jgi:tRNA (guanine37-N1)-methyltransferase
MEFDILTLYPEMFEQALRAGVLGRAQEKGLIRIHIHQIRDYALDKHHSVDHTPYGGGAGMVMRADVLANAWENAKARAPGVPALTLLMTPQGKPYRQESALRFAQRGSASRLILIAGRFEGVDERFIEACVDEEISLGDFVMSGGEIAAMAVVDSVARLLPGVLGNSDSLASESFSAGLLEYPQYTHPRDFQGRSVPEVLLSGDHAKIALWRRSVALERTKLRRPDLLVNINSKEKEG